MRIPKLKNAIKWEEAAGNPIFIEGSPGTGKSQLVHQLCQEDGKECIDIRLALLNPVDLRGIPIIKGDKVFWVPPIFLVNKKNARFFLDEINAAPSTTQAAAYQWVLDRRIGEWEMDPSCTIIAAGNRATDRAIVYEMPAPLRNRFAIYELEPDLEDWKDWALGTAKLPPIIPAFLTFSQHTTSTELKYGLLFHFDPKIHKKNFPTPRQWEKLGHLIETEPSCQLDTEIVAAHIGEGEAIQFVQFCRIADKMLDIEMLLKGEYKKPLEGEPSIIYALCGAIVGSLIKLKPKHRIEATRNVITYCLDYLTQNQEYAILIIKDFCRSTAYKEISGPIIATSEWKRFSEAFQKLLA